MADAAHLSDNAYRYSLTADGPPDPEGRQCYAFDVSNILLADSLDTGHGAGANHLYLSYAMVPADATNGPTQLRQLHLWGARYPVAGVKSPPDGILTVQASDFAPTRPPAGP